MTALIIGEETLRLMQGLGRWARVHGCQSSNLLFPLTSNNHATLINGTDTGTVALTQSQTRVWKV